MRSDTYLPGGVILLFAIIFGIVGWGVISLIIWLFSFVHVSFGG